MLQKAEKAFKISPTYVFVEARQFELQLMVFKTENCFHM